MGNKQNISETPKQKNEIDENIRQQAYILENHILSQMSDLNLNTEIYTKDVPIKILGPNYVHTIISHEAHNTEFSIFPENTYKKQNLVFLHGYQGSSITFIKLFKYLIPYYNIFAPDHLGMGLSSRPNIKFTSATKTIDYFCEYLEIYFKSLELEQIHLVGHSLGGYIAAQYTLKYPSRVTKLTLLSPAGITNQEKGGKINERIPKIKRFAFSLLTPIWKLQLTNQKVYKNFMGKFFLSKGLRKRYDISVIENDWLARLSEFCYMYPEDLDSSVYFIFQPPMPTPRIPLEDLLDEIKVKVDFYFGENDWLDHIGCKRLCHKNVEKYRYFEIKKAGHNFNLENYFDLSQMFLENNILP